MVWGAQKNPAGWILDLRDGLGSGGAKGARTPDLVAASDALSQLSYSPITFYVADFNDIFKRVKEKTKCFRLR